MNVCKRLVSWSQVVFQLLGLSSAHKGIYFRSHSHTAIPSALTCVHPLGQSSFIRQHCDQRMGQDVSKSSRSDTVSTRRAMDAEQNLPRVLHNLTFRVLVIGRANAGKTSILQRICDTTEGPDVYRHVRQGNRERVRSRS